VVRMAAMDARTVAGDVWGRLGGAPPDLERLTVTGPGHVLPSVFPVTALAGGVVAVATLAAGELWRVRGGPEAPVAVDTRHAALACRSERLLEAPDADLGAVWGAVSGTYAARDGWVRIHAELRRHRAVALDVLALAELADRGDGSGDGVDADLVRGAVARWGALELEEALHRDGGCGAALRTLEEWQRSAQAAVLARMPLVTLLPLGPDDGEHHPPPDPERPLSGMRVLDLTRVIAGPVAGRFLAAYGAEVLRVDAPGGDDHGRCVADTTVGKRTTALDLHSPADKDRFEALVRQADVVLCAYRPGALADLGYDPATLADLRPGLVVGTLSAYGDVGPWGTRRGFDSLVQMASGLADEGRRAVDADRPVPLPAQVLDHATGYLLAAGVLVALARRRAAARGGGWLVQTSLARTSCYLDALGRGGVVDLADPPDRLPDDLAVELDGPYGRSRHVACPGFVVGAAPHWRTGPVPLGHDTPTWPAV
jgi:CoA transferase family III